MRLPLSKVYRAFPELDRFSDEDCERFVRRAHRKHPWTLALAAVGALLAMVLGWVAAFPLIFAGVSLLPVRLSTHPVIQVSAFSAAVTAGALAALVVRDLWLRWAVSRSIDGSRCPGCEYSLLGLPVLDGSLDCPECGRRATLAELGMTAEELLAGVGGAGGPRREVAGGE